MNTLQIGDYIVKRDRFIGIGQNTVAYLCYKNNNPQEEYCIKMLRLKKWLSYDFLDSYIEVIKKLMHHNCENLVKVIDVVRTPEYFCIVMEICDYDLQQECQQLKKNKEWFSRNEQVEIIKSILKGAKVLIENNITLDDQQLKSILVKLVNKGLPNERKIYKVFIYKLDALKFSQERQIWQPNKCLRYTSFYLTPEIFLGQIFSAESNIYSLGVIFHQIIFNGIFPGNPQDFHEVQQFMERIQLNPYKCQKLNDDIGNKLTDLIDSMLLFDQNDRISFENLFQILQDPLISQGDNIQNQQDDNLKSKYNQLYMLIDIFYRKSILCQSVVRYLKFVLIETNTDFFIIQLLIGIIGFEEIRFALALLHTKESDIYPYVKTTYDIQFLKNYLEYSKSSLKDKNLHKKIYQQSYKQQRELYDDYSDFIQHINQTNNINQFKDMIELFKEQQQQQCNIQKCCEMLEELLNKQKVNQLICNFDDKIQQNIQKIRFIETKFKIEQYTVINPNNIFEMVDILNE